MWLSVAVSFLFFSPSGAFLGLKPSASLRKVNKLEVRMAIDDFVIQKLQLIQNTYDALSERLGDPDVLNDQTLLLSTTQERASIEKAVEAFIKWKDMEQERLDMQEMEQDPSADAELREYSRSEQKVLVATQEELESDLMLMLLPQDPLDEKNVMLEVSRRTLYFPSYP